MKYITSSNIAVFPSTKRGNEQTSARELSEKSLARLVSQIIDTDSFIISYKDNIIEFNIHGYYFKFSDVTNYLITNFASATDVYAHILISDTGTSSTVTGQDAEIDELIGQDISGTFRGLRLDSTILADPSSESDVGDTNCKCYYLKLFTRADTSSSWEIPQDSYLKFQSQSLQFEVDGGLVSY